jgi:hypothetical protein
MPDNWGYVFSAYGLAAVALLGYWRRLVERAKRLPGSQGRTGKETG